MEELSNEQIKAAEKINKNIKKAEGASDVNIQSPNHKIIETRGLQEEGIIIGVSKKVINVLTPGPLLEFLVRTIGKKSKD